MPETPPRSPAAAQTKGAASADRGPPRAATASRLNRLHSGHAERNRKLEERKAELERKKLEAEEASMVQWNAGKKKPKQRKSPGRTKAPRASGSNDGDGSNNPRPTAEGEEPAPRPPAPAAPAASAAASTAPAVATPSRSTRASTSPAAPVAAAAGGFALPDVTPREFEVFVEAVRGYQGLPSPAPAGPPLTPSATVSAASDVTATAADSSPSLDELAEHGKAAEKEFTITELPGPSELQQQQQPPQQQQQPQKSGRSRERTPREPAPAATSSGRGASGVVVAPPSPGSMRDISRAVADAREADEDGDRRTAWMLHDRAVREFQTAARRCPHGMAGWPAELREDEEKVVARTAALKREVEQQGRAGGGGGGARSKKASSGSGGAGIFGCCGSKKTSGGTNSPGRPAAGNGSARMASAVVDAAAAAATATDGPEKLRPASAPASHAEERRRRRGSDDNDAAGGRDGRGRRGPGDMDSRPASASRGGRQYSPRGPDYESSQSRSPVQAKATTTQREIQNLHKGLPTKLAASGKYLYLSLNTVQSRHSFYYTERSNCCTCV